MIDHLLSILAPYECLGCAAEGSLLCTACIQQLPAIPERCYSCRMPSANARTCSVCGKASSLHSVWAGTNYGGTAKDLVWRLKSSGARRAVRQMAAHLAGFIDRDPGLTIVPVPTATSRVRRRGYDQARLLARELSRQTRLPYLDCLARNGQTHQVGASRARRLRQLNGAFRLSGSVDVYGLNIVLVDDVLTTGATLESAANVLKKHGAGEVRALVFAQA